MTAASTLTCPMIDSRPWASPDAHLLLRADAPRDEWLRYRRAGIGSSDASAVVGVNQWTSPYEVWAEKRGLLPEEPDNDAMELGRLFEPLIADRWSRKRGITIRRAGLMGSRERPWQLASVDRLAECGGIVEIKTLNFRVAEEWDDGQTPDHAEVQVQHQMAVTGRDHAHVVGLQDGRTWIERTVARDENLIDDLNEIEARFWSLVVNGEEPPVDGHPATTDALNARWAGTRDVQVQLGPEAEMHVRARDLWSAQLEEAEEGKALAENHIRALMAAATVGILPSGRRVTYRRNGNFASSRFTAAEPELAAALTVPLPALDVAALKRDHPELYTTHRARVLRVQKES